MHNAPCKPECARVRPSRHRSLTRRENARSVLRVPPPFARAFWYYVFPLRRTTNYVVRPSGERAVALAMIRLGPSPPCSRQHLGLFLGVAGCVFERLLAHEAQAGVFAPLRRRIPVGLPQISSVRARRGRFR
eukprot:2636808-Prymnesium_polylepis.1